MLSYIDTPFRGQVFGGRTTPGPVFAAFWTAHWFLRFCWSGIVTSTASAGGGVGVLSPPTISPGASVFTPRLPLSKSTLHVIHDRRTEREASQSPKFWQMVKMTLEVNRRAKHIVDNDTSTVIDQRMKQSTIGPLVLAAPGRAVPADLTWTDASTAILRHPPAGLTNDTQP
jgi:hypothetical protein